MKLSVLICALLFTLSGTAEAHNLNQIRSTFGQHKYGYGERVSHNVHHAIRGTWKCQRELGRSRTGSSGRYRFRPVTYRRYVLREWRKRLKICTSDLRQVRSANVNWWLATTYANTVFPGTRGWLISCSASEGGHTEWVPNRQGSGASGWMQFMSGTFYAYVDDAFSATRLRGFVALKAWRSWYSPAGQALTAGYMRWSGRDGSHWVGSGC